LTTFRAATGLRYSRRDPERQNAQVMVSNFAPGDVEIGRAAARHYCGNEN
jgi:hypothetical protein